MGKWGERSEEKVRGEKEERGEREERGGRETLTKLTATLNGGFISNLIL